MKMLNRKKIIIILIILFSIIMIDRYTLMPNRIKGLYLWESGPSLGDPISFKHDFYLEGTKVKFKEFINKEFWPEIEKNRNDELYFAGCYFGNLYIYNIDSHKLTVYSKK